MMGFLDSSCPCCRKRNNFTNHFMDFFLSQPNESAGYLYYGDKPGFNHNASDSRFTCAS